jgi:hypothetical protein
VYIAIGVAVVVVLAAGYWWLNRPPGRYKPDNSGLYPINVNGKYGFMDRSGKTLITPQFDGVIGFSEGLASVRVGTKWGYINTKGVVAITPQFDEAREFQYGRAAVKLGSRAGFIDKDGKYISSPDFRWVGMFYGDLAPAMTADGVVAFVNRSGKLEMPGKFESIGGFGFTGGLAVARSGGKWGFIDTAGKWVIDPQFEGAANFSDGLAVVIVGGRTGYIDKNGKFVVNPQFDFGGEFHEGLAFFGNSGKYGLIDTKGRVVVEATFLGPGMFSDGLSPAKTEDGWGFIDRTGKMVVSPQFDTAEGFQNGLARVTALGKEAYITASGAFVVDPFPGTTVPAEKARRAVEAAKAAAAKEAATPKTAERVRVEQGIQGEWVGTFFNYSNARLTITNADGVFGAMLVAGGLRVVYSVQLGVTWLADGHLYLDQVDYHAPAGDYPIGTADLALSADGLSLTGRCPDAVIQPKLVSLTKSHP